MAKKFEKRMIARGSLVLMRRKCGRKGCRCARGEAHSTWVLSYRLNGKTRLLCLRERDLGRVKAALRRYRQAQAKLEREARAGIKILEKEIAERKRQERARP